MSSQLSVSKNEKIKAFTGQNLETSTFYFELSQLPLQEKNQLQLLEQNREMLIEIASRFKFMNKEIAYLTKTGRD
jgi:hypothetical protein